MKQHVKDILTDPEFTPRQTLWQWLAHMFSKWDKPDVSLPSWLTSFLSLLLICWCVLALIAIVIHLVWTLIQMSPGRSRMRGVMSTATLAQDRLHELSIEDLLREMEQLVAAGEFKLALAFMMAALLRNMDQAGRIEFHPSKTNGDYVREYQPLETSRTSAFKDFTRQFDFLVYGGSTCGRTEYSEMQNLYEGLIEHAA